MPREWLDDAAALLAEPDPGPTRWLIENLFVDQALAAAAGRWKTTKSYGLLEMSIAVATGRPAFGAFEIPEPGPVVFANEESGRIALRRRLDALCRGRAIDPEELRGRLHVAANARVRLDDAHWQNELLDLGKEIKPRLFVFDPLARMKAAERDENLQVDMADLIDFLRLLRDESAASVCFVHHTGHAGEHMRGSSDLESAWETKLTWKRDGQSPLVRVEAEHREAEAAEPFQYRLAWDGETRTMRLNLVEPDGLPTLADRIVSYLKEHDEGSTDEIRDGVNTRRSDVKRTLEHLEQAGTAHRTPSHRRDGLGRPTAGKVWKLSNQATLALRPDTGTNQDGQARGDRTPSHRPTSIRGGGTDGVPDDP